MHATQDMLVTQIRRPYEGIGGGGWVVVEGAGGGGEEEEGIAHEEVMPLQVEAEAEYGTEFR